MGKRNEHSWRTRTADGERRDMIAQRFGGRWTLCSRVKGAESWSEHPEPALVDLIELHRILFAKYQRKRVPWEHVAEVQDWIRALGGELD